MGAAEPVRPLAQPIAAGWRAEALAEASGGNPVAFATRDGVVVLSVSTAGEVRSWRSTDGGPFRGLTFHPSGTAVLVGHATEEAERVLTAWTWAAGSEAPPTTVAPRR